MPVSSSTIRTLCMVNSGGGDHGFGNDRQLYDDTRSDRMVFFYANRSVMFFDDPIHDRQAEAGSALSGGEIRQEKFFLQFASHTVAGVRDCDFDCIAAGHQRG